MFVRDYSLPQSSHFVAVFAGLAQTQMGVTIGQTEIGVRRTSFETK